MANKRMLSMTICDSDQFLDMPLSAQCLYFHLNIRADNDGFVGNPKKIMKLIGAAEDDLKLLIAKSFILTFDSGVIVIKHWRIHNTLTKGRYHETAYMDEKNMLLLKENGAYSFTHGNPIDDSAKVEMFKLSDKRRTSGEQAENYERKRKEKKGKEKNIEERFYEDDDLNETFKDYVAMRKATKEPLTPRAITIAKNKIEEYSKGNKAIAIALIEQSILNNWKGIFPLKEMPKEKSVNTIKHKTTEQDEKELSRFIRGE